MSYLSWSNFLIILPLLGKNDNFSATQSTLIMSTFLFLKFVLITWYRAQLDQSASQSGNLCEIIAILLDPKMILCISLYTVSIILD